MARKKGREGVAHEEGGPIFVPNDRPELVRPGLTGDDALRHQIASTFREMMDLGGQHNFIVLDSGQEKGFYVQFKSSCGSAIIFGEAVSDRYLRHPLSPAQRAELQRLRWRPPTVRKFPNYFQLWTLLTDADRLTVADVALETLERVYGWQRGSPLKIVTRLDW